MIYLDNAATTYPKPESVLRAIARGLERAGGNPGRGGHRLSMAAAEELWACREVAARLFGAPSPENVVFTQNCTMSLNMVIKGLLSQGGHALVSDVEHNAVIRPLEAIGGRGYRAYTAVETVVGDADATVENFRRAITPRTRLLLCAHCSNVTGEALPLRALGALAKEYGLVFAVDAAQSGGVLPIDMQEMGIDFLCLAGHKGLYGPMGTGLLISSGRVKLQTWMEGGTGSLSLSPLQPPDLPDRLESGTPNVAGICGLRAGMEWVAQKGVERIAAHERAVLTPIDQTLRTLHGVQVHTRAPQAHGGSPLCTFTVQGVPSERVAELLASVGIATRAGYHCAPSAHKKLGTPEHGAVRLSPSAFTDRRAVDAVCRTLRTLRFS